MINELFMELNIRGANFIKTVDISMLSDNEKRGYNVAILIGIVLSPEYILRLSNENKIDYSEFGEKEHRTGELAEWAADFFIASGYKAFAQSDRDLIVDVYHCATCLKCLVNCTWTQKYMKNNSVI